MLYFEDVHYGMIVKTSDGRIGKVTNKDMAYVQNIAVKFDSSSYSFWFNCAGLTEVSKEEMVKFYKENSWA